MEIILKKIQGGFKGKMGVSRETFNINTGRRVSVSNFDLTITDIMHYTLPNNSCALQ